MQVRHATRQDCHDVAADLLAASAAELTAAGRDATDSAAIGNHLHDLAINAFLHKALCGADGRALGIASAWNHRPQGCAVRLLLAAQWLTIAPAAYRWLVKSFLPMLADRGLRFAETHGLDAPAGNRAWLLRAGFADYGLVEGKAGVNGERYRHLLWEAPLV